MGKRQQEVAVRRVVAARRVVHARCGVASDVARSDGAQLEWWGRPRALRGRMRQLRGGGSSKSQRSQHLAAMIVRHRSFRIYNVRRF